MEIAAVGGNFAARLLFEQVQKIGAGFKPALPRCPGVEPSVDGVERVCRGANCRAY